MDDKLSVLDIEQFIFSFSTFDFVPYQSRSYFSGNSDAPLWIYKPAMARRKARPANRIEAEYLEGRSPDHDSNHNGAVGIALFQTVGLLSPEAGNALAKKTLSVGEMSEIQSVSDSRVKFAVGDEAADHRLHVVCDLTDSGSARIVQCTVTSLGTFVTELSYTYDASGIAEKIEITKLSDGTVLSHIELTMLEDSATKEISREQALFPGVPVGRVISNTSDQYFYIDGNGARVEFNPNLDIPALRPNGRPPQVPEPAR